MVSPNTYVIKKYWIDVVSDGSPREIVTLAEANRIQEMIFSEAYLHDLFGYAKAVSVNGQWGVQVVTATPDPGEVFKKIEDTYSNVFLTSSEKTTDKHRFSDLLSTIKGLISFIEEHKTQIVGAQQSTRKLNKLVIKILQVHSWPYQEGINSIGNVIKIFSDFKSSQLSVADQTSFNSYLKEFNTVLKFQDQSLEVDRREVSTSMGSAPEDFIKGFCQHRVNTRELSYQTLRQILGELVIRFRIMEDFCPILRDLSNPITSISPNQAIALQLCYSPTLVDRNILFKLEPGLGKSLIIALAALNEAKQVIHNPNGRVFVFFTYDDIAKRDHALGRQIFEKEAISSICISQIEDLSSFRETSKIIYADIEVLESLAREIVLKLLQNRATEFEAAFIKALYGAPNEEVRIILDEYDFHLINLENREPIIQNIPESLLDPNFVKSNKMIWPYLAELTREPTPLRTDTIDPRDGQLYLTADWYDHASKTFNLPPSIFRFSSLIQRAKRVIGLSGTPLVDENYRLDHPLFFELSSLQNPTIFSRGAGSTGQRASTGERLMLGDPLPTRSDHMRPQRDFFSALHELSRFFINGLTSSSVDENKRRKWLMFLGDAYSTRYDRQKINSALARELCGTYFQENVIPERFLTR